MLKDAPVQFNYYSMVEARALVTNYYQPTRARRLWRHYLSSLTGGAGSLLLTVVFYPLFSRRMDTRLQACLTSGKWRWKPNLERAAATMGMRSSTPFRCFRLLPLNLITLNKVNIKLMVQEAYPTASLRSRSRKPSWVNS